MRESKPQSQTLQVVSVKRSRTRRKLHGGLTPNQQSTVNVVTRKILEADGCCDMTVDNLAAHCGIGPRQLQRDLDVAVSLGKIIRIRRPKFRDRSETNLLMLPTVRKRGVGDINGGEIQRTLKPNTTTPREVPRAKSYTQLRWEWNQAKRPKHHYPNPQVGRCSMRHIEAFKIAANNAIYNHNDPELEELKRLEAERVERDRQAYLEWKQQKEEQEKIKMGNRARLRGARKRQREADQMEDYKVWFDGVMARLEPNRERIDVRVTSLKPEEIEVINRYMSKEQNQVIGLSEGDRDNFSDREYLAFCIAAMEEDYLDSLDFYDVDGEGFDCTQCSMGELWGKIDGLMDTPIELRLPG